MRLEATMSEPVSPVRAGDADRERTATLLRDHCADGRLTAEELEERLETAYAAKTLGELDALLADLPGPAVVRRPDRLRPAPWRGRAPFVPVAILALAVAVAASAATGAHLVWVVWPLFALLWLRRARWRAA